MDWKIFWRIIFDVIDGNPRLQLEMTLWELPSSNRLGRLVKDLVPGIMRVGIVHFVKDRALFFGGYLECQLELNSWAKELLDKAGIDIDDPIVLRQASESINGENVGIDTEVVLYEKSARTSFPIFYYPQPSLSGVHLVEGISPSGDRTIEWTISDLNFVSDRSFTLEAFEGQHRLRVRQDQGTRESDVFEFLVDSVPLGSAPTPRDHLFIAEDPQTFYIGRTPGHPDGLFGEIIRLEFDPNSTCPSCPSTANKPGDNPDY